MRGLLTALLPETRASVGTQLARPSESAGWLEDLLGGAMTSAGRKVTPENALSVTAVYAGIRLISSSVAQLPLHVYRREDSARTPLPTHRLERLLNDAPNEFLTAIEFRELLTSWAIMHGNAIAYLDLRSNYDIEQIIPLDPNSVRFWLTPDKQSMVYEYIKPNGGSVWLPRDQVLHLRAPLGTRWLGLGLLQIAREAIGLAMVAEEHAGRFYSNAAAPAGVLQVPGTLKTDAFNRLKQQWNNRHKGTENAFTTAILEGGVTWNALALNLKDQQFLETRQFQLQEMARAIGCPPHLLGDLSRTTNNNVEAQGIEFVRFGTGPWCRRWEQRIKLDCLGAGEQRSLYVRHNEDAMLRGETLTRYRAYQIGRQGGWLSVNDIRGWEDMNPVPDGDTRLAPLNMVPADQFEDLTKDDGDAAAGGEPGTQAGGTAPDLTRAARSMAAAITPLVYDAAMRAARRANGEIKRARDGVVGAAAAEQHLEWCLRTVTPIAESFAVGVAVGAGLPLSDDVRELGQRAAALAVVNWSSALRSSNSLADVGTLAGATIDQITQLVTTGLLAFQPLQEA